jgi:hypothetical protein
VAQDIEKLGGRNVINTKHKRYSPGPNAQEYIELDHRYISKGSGVKLLAVVPEHADVKWWQLPTI